MDSMLCDLITYSLVVYKVTASAWVCGLIMTVLLSIIASDASYNTEKAAITIIVSIWVFIFMISVVGLFTWIWGWR